MPRDEPPGLSWGYLHNVNRWLLLQPRSRGLPRSGVGPALTPGCAGANGVWSPVPRGFSMSGLSLERYTGEGLKPNREMPVERGSRLR
jgi:hypothetical protein